MNPNLERLNELNRLFCSNALKIRLRRGEFWENTDVIPDISKEGVEVHRSIINSDGTELLFIPDLDFYSERVDTRVDRTYECMHSLSTQFPGWEIKFSGNVGFHPMQKIDLRSKKWADNKGERDAIYEKYGLLKKLEKVEEEIQKLGGKATLNTDKTQYLFKERERIATKGLNQYMTHVLYGLSKHVSGVTVDQDQAKKQDLVWMDLKITSDKLIRGYCINHKSGLYSVPADPKTEELDDILEKAALQKDITQISVDIPEFSLYGLADPRDDIPNLEKTVETTRDEVKVAGKGKVAQDKFWPCMKKALSLEPNQLSQHRAFFICTYMNKAGYSKKEILHTFEKLYKEKYNEAKAREQVDFIVGKGYGFANCPTIRDDYGLCTGPTCFRYKKTFPK